MVGSCVEWPQNSFSGLPRDFETLLMLEYLIAIRDVLFSFLLLSLMVILPWWFICSLVRCIWELLGG